MGTFIAVLHIIVALVLIGLVLIQDSKGGGALGIGGGGGGSNSVLGATGASTLAAKMTRIAAVVFALTSIGLSVISAQSSKSVLDSVPGAAAPAATPPVLPATEGGAAAPTSVPSDAKPADSAVPATTAPAAPEAPAANPAK